MYYSVCVYSGFVFIPRQHAMHAERDIVLALPSVRLSVTLWYCI